MRSVKWAVRIIGGAMLVASGAGSAAASTITFDFDCNITGNSCTGVTSVGTLAISDSAVNTDWVDVSLSLTSGDPQTFLFNFTGFPLPTGYVFTADGTTVDVDQNDLTANGYNAGKFDLQIPDTGTISGNPFNTVLKLTNGSDFTNLDAMMFAALSTNDALYAAVQKTTGGGWFGATTCVGCTNGGGSDPETPAPEPASLLLLGTGLLFGAARLRRRSSRA